MQFIERPVNEGILILDYGSQYTLLIARRLREIGAYSEIIDPRSDLPPKGFQYKGVILSGGPDSLTVAESRRLPKWVINADVPILGICYGLQLLVEHFGGTIRAGLGREYGRAQLSLSPDMHGRATKVFYGMPDKQTVWMSHGDDVEKMPPELAAVGISDSNTIGVVVHKERPIVGLQFHPEVQHTEHGATILKQFAQDLCQLKLNWQPQNMVTAISEKLKTVIGNGRILMAVSGGVDSSVAAALFVKAIGPEHVTAVFIDHGMLRKNEATWVVDNLRFLGLKHIAPLDCSEIFLGALRGVKDPEQKRKIIGQTFIQEFERFAREHKEEFTHFGQGTLYPDVIESAGHGAGTKVIKTHHNVGGLPEKLELELVEPFRFLFKDEVRSIGEELRLPKGLLMRHPFPGPGLAVRILGEVSEDRIKILQEADHIFIEELKKANLYDQVWQAFAVLLPVKSVGVMGDNRTYQAVCALRAVSASDGMTAGVSNLPMEFLTNVSDKIVRSVEGINRVVYDITTKPPATIEWE